MCELKVGNQKLTNLIIFINQILATYKEELQGDPIIQVSLKWNHIFKSTGFY